MVRLFNITIKGNEIACDYDPENCGKIGHLTANVDTEEITNIEYSDYEFGKKMYAAHVRQKLFELLLKKEVVPSEAIAIWY